MLKIKETEKGDNWTVVVFNCPSDKWPRVLVDLFEYIEKTKKADIPHFTIRFAKFKPSPSLTISFRVLRDPAHAIFLEKQLAYFMDKEKLEYSTNPEGEDHFGKCHAWIRRGKKDSRWPRKRCEALNRLSRFVVSIAKDALFDPENRFEWGHLMINMLGLKESIIVGHMSSYSDLLTGKFKGPYHTNLIDTRQ